MFEVSESELKPVNNAVEAFAGGEWAGVVRECVLGALATTLISADDQIVSLYHRCAAPPGTTRQVITTCSADYIFALQRMQLSQ